MEATSSSQETRVGHLWRLHALHRRQERQEEGSRMKNQPDGVPPVIPGTIGTGHKTGVTPPV
ncbi:unnamed protein product [Linum tenue]|uniref:Uncharacterized protein n=1 Tax=Linum tenue TaxID=586396 RepID=A0AAV0LYH8_9ROSI|nr:unnamed protein product [Linum tenue]